mmetsp:Transcript_50935/g.91030  ORF Transcript_50935/g.91030 Transcript_50935/m.91030 type:complete len:151 (-) Transcript_50935:1239-1691(-)
MVNVDQPPLAPNSPNRLHICLVAMPTPRFQSCSTPLVPVSLLPRMCPASAPESFLPGPLWHLNQALSNFTPSLLRLGPTYIMPATWAFLVLEEPGHQAILVKHVLTLQHLAPAGRLEGLKTDGAVFHIGEILVPSIGIQELADPSDLLLC